MSENRYPFTSTVLTARLMSWMRYRRTLADAHGELEQVVVDRALAMLRQADRTVGPKGRSPVTERLVAEHLSGSANGLTAHDVGVALGISRATAQRYLAALADAGHATMTMRYGSTGRPEHLYAWEAR